MQSQKVRPGYKFVTYRFGRVEEIPRNWVIKKIQEISQKIVSGGTPNTSKSEYWDGNIPWTRSAVLTDQYLTQGEKFISKSGLKKSSAVIIPRDNLIIASRVSMGNMSINKIDIAINQDVTGVSLDKKQASEEYLYWLLRKDSHRITSLSQGTTIQGFTRRELSRLRIALPPLKEQRKIASILSNIDSAIQQTNSILEKSKDLKQGLMQKLLTKGIGHTKFKKINFGGQIDVQIPIEYEIKTMEEISVDGTQNGLAISVSDYGKGIPIVGMTKFYASEILSLDNMSEVSISKKNREKFSLRSFDLLFGRRSMDGQATGGAGKCVIVPEIKSPIVFESSIIRMSVKKEINPFFIYQLLKSQFGRRLMIRIIRVSAVSGISSSDLQKIKIPLPPVQEQEKIVSILSNIDSQIQQIQKNKSNLETKKKGLMQKLLTGKIRV